MFEFNRESAIALLKGMLAAQTRPAIHFIRAEDVMGPKQIKHTYRFFVVNRSEIYNVSGLITAIFGVTVHDRSQAFSINALSADEDLKNFGEAIRRFTELPVTLVDLLVGATDVLNFVINPMLLEFISEPEVRVSSRFPAITLPPEADGNHG
jgi:hypothetical protein